LSQVRNLLSEAKLNGIYLSNVKREGVALPILAGTILRRGDVVELVGRPAEVDQGAALLGSAEPTGGKSDLAYHGLAIVVGTLLGLLTATIGGIPVTLGVGGGVLVSGLCFGWWHSRYPAHGTLPEAAQWILSEFGLSAFAAAVGLSAGPKAVAAIQQEGAVLLLAGMAVTLIPLIVAFFVGRHLLKLHPVILLGALCGGQTVAAALNAVNEATDSMTPVLGFTVAYAIANVLLVVWGPIIVGFA
jgi:AspT/YidE/YbjL antiporter-like protein